MPDMIFTWMTDDGPKTIDELTREEMIEAIHYLAGIHTEHFTPRNIKARAIGHVEMLKRGA